MILLVSKNSLFRPAAAEHCGYVSLPTEGVPLITRCLSLQDIDISDLFRGPKRGACTYTLRSMACFSGTHWVAMLRQPRTGAWAVLDGAVPAVIGGWREARERCAVGALQPSLLFFERTHHDIQHT